MISATASGIHPDEPAALGRERFDLVAPYERDPARWIAVEWADAETGEVYSITTNQFAGGTAIRVKSIRDVVALYRRKREAKSLHANGMGCTRETKGLLDRRPIRDLVIRHIGKEANEIEELAAGLLAADDVTTAYDHRRRGVCAQLIRPALQAFPEGVIVQATGVSRGTITRLRRGSAPDPASLRPLLVGIARLCRDVLDGAASDAEPTDLAVLAAWRDRVVEAHQCPACGQSPPPGRTYCDSACKQAAYRRRQRGRTLAQ